MSYIIKSENPFASTKLTEKGREKLAKGQLTFSSWAIGDSEVNYNREIFVDDATVSGSTKILRPKDRQPDLKYYINTGGTSPLMPFATNDIRCIKAIINNEADERGHFTGDLTNGFTTNTSFSAYTRTFGILDNSQFDGSNTIDITGVQEGDFILFKVGYSDYTNETPTPHLWFKAQSVVSNTITLDRDLPILGSGNVTYIVYKGGELYDNEPDSISYWDTGTLSFDSSCDISVTDVPFWNMNHVHSEDILGITGTTEYEKHNKFGSYDYLGEKNNYLFDSANTYKSVGIIHYTNKTISNLYGEYFFIDNDSSKTVKLHLPNVMYHRRNFSGSTTGDKMGMTFIASGATKTVNNLTYVSLMEDPTLINGDSIEVGRVYPSLKLVVITDAELLAAMSYKSNRNWTLPKLNLTMVNPLNGVGTGPLGPNKTIYVTYTIDNNSGVGINPVLPCQNYASVTNSTTLTKDVQFNIEDLDLFPFMRVDNTTDGFYGDTFKIMYQITDGSRPTAGDWKVLDFTSSVNGGSGFIDPNDLEVQNPNSFTPKLQISQTNNASANTYSIIDTLNMAPSLSPNKLQFGDERFFYGNLETYIGATIYKTLFKITINASDFNKTTNITRSADPTTNPPAIRVSEVGIYDNSGDLVIIAKLSKPIKLVPGNTVMIELSMDF